MKKIYTICIALVWAASSNAQTIFWIEEFTNGCSSLCTSYSGPNGAWTFASNGPANACGGPTTPNLWYISCAENGNASGTCGAGCGNNATLHVGNDPNSPSAAFVCPTGDCGAAYDAGGSCDLLGTPPSVITDILATSPTIDCSGRASITLLFNYIERGQGTNDNATVMYYDGSTWSLLADMPKTPLSCSPQGRWTTYNVSLPVSADNNPNVAIAFHWVNDDDGAGSDPSFAVDSVRLSVPSTAGPVAGFTQGTTTGCDSLCVTFTDGSTGATSWSWLFPGGTPSSSTSASPVVCYNAPGTYDVTQIVTNASGSDTLVKPGLVTITPTPVPFFNTSDQNLCVGDCINYTDQTVGAVSSYIWTFQGGTPLNSSNQNPTNICYNVPGSFNTTLTVTNGGCTNSNTSVGYINVTQPTPPVITLNGDTLVSTAALTYQWYEVTAGAIPAGIFQFYVATLGGNYFVCITDAFGCSACSDTVHVDQESVPEFDVENLFDIYPNPGHDQITIHTSGQLNQSKVQVQDATGRLVKKDVIHFIHQKAILTVSDLANGNYLLQLLDNRNKIIFSTPVVKQ